MDLTAEQHRRWVAWQCENLLAMATAAAPVFAPYPAALPGYEHALYCLQRARACLEETHGAELRAWRERRDA